MILVAWHVDTWCLATIEHQKPGLPAFAGNDEWCKRSLAPAYCGRDLANDQRHRLSRIDITRNFTRRSKGVSSDAMYFMAQIEKALHAPIQLGAVVICALQWSCLTSNAFASAPKVTAVGAAEYSTFYLAETGVLYSMGAGNALGELGLNNGGNPAYFATPMSFPAGTVIRQVSGGLHQSLALDSNGDVWVWGAFLSAGNPPGGGSSNRSVPYKVLSDNLGNAFGNVSTIYAGATINAAIKSDGSLWIWGDAAGGWLANGQNGAWTEYPTRVNLAGPVKQFSQSYAATALLQDGSVYSWGGGGGYQSRRDLGLPYAGIDLIDYSLPQRVNFPAGAPPMVAMAVSGAGARVFLSNDGQLFGYGYHGELLGQGTGASNVAVNLATPKRIDGDLAITIPVNGPVRKIAASNTAFFAILNDASLWAWGDAAQGEVGNGQGMNWALAYNCQSLGTCGISNPGGGGGPYKSSWGVAEVLVRQATRLLPGVAVDQVFAGNAAAYYAYAIDSNQRLYSWGRNKTGNLGNGVYAATSTQAANLPNSWDVTTATPVSPLTMTTYRCVPSPFCLNYPADQSCRYTQSDGICPASVSLLIDGFE